MGVFDVAIDFAKAAKPTIIQAQRGIQGMIYQLEAIQNWAVCYRHTVFLSINSKYISTAITN